MIIKIPTLEKEFIDGKIVRKESELSVQIDTSFLAHLKWEEHFQKTVGYDLTTYTAIVRDLLKDEERSKGNFLSLLKWLYCFVNSDKLPTFKDFLKLFDVEIADEILGKIGVVLEEIGKSASKN